MERCYRELARDTADTWERITLVEEGKCDQAEGHDYDI